MKKIAALAAVAGVAAVMLAPVDASAESAELRITGTIRPSTCKPAFAGGGVVDYGTMPASSLNQTTQTTLEEKSIQLTLTCDAPALFAFKVIDERAGTAVTSLVTIPGFTPKAKFGLGAVDGKNIGAYSLEVTKATADQGATRRLASTNGGTAWAVSGGLAADGSNLIAFAGSATGMVPTAHTSITADIRVGTAIDQASNLPLTQKVPLDGLSTFEVVYL